MQTVRFPSGDYELEGHLYRTSDAAPTLVLLHGMTFYSFVFEELAPMLMESGFNCFCPDFRCHGHSEGPHGYYTMQGLVQDVTSALDYLEGQGLGNFGLFGNSMGATAAVYAAAQDKRIRCVAACNTATKPSAVQFTTFRTWLLQSAHALAKIVPFRIPVGLFMPETLVLDDAARVVRVRKDRFIKPARWIAPSTFLDLYHWNAEDKVKNISCPLLVLRSKRDRLQPQSEADRLFAAARPPKEYQRIDASHVPNWEYAGLLHPRLYAFFSEHLAQ